MRRLVWRSAVDVAVGIGTDKAIDWSATARSCQSTRNFHLFEGDSHALSRHIRTIHARQKHTTRRAFHRLTRSSDRRRRSECFHAFFTHGGEHERGVDGSWADGVDADTLLFHDLVRQCTGKGDDGTLGGRVVEEFWVANKGYQTRPKE